MADRRRSNECWKVRQQSPSHAGHRMTRVIRVSSRQVVIASGQDCSIVVWLLAGSETPESIPQEREGKGEDY